MATTTTRLALRKPDRTDLISVITDLDGVYDKIDAAVGFTMCTSTTRPSSPWLGQPIYEADTTATRFWSGSSWVVANSLGGCTTGYTLLSGAATQTNTSYAVPSGMGSFGFAFAVPPSGIVGLQYSSRMHIAASGFALLTPVVRTGATVGSGTAITAAADDNALQTTAVGTDERVCDFIVFSGTPGSVYNVTMQARVSGSNTGTFSSTKIQTDPRLA